MIQKLLNKKSVRLQLWLAALIERLQGVRKLSERVDALERAQMRSAIRLERHAHKIGFAHTDQLTRNDER